MAADGGRDERLMGLMELALAIPEEQREVYLRQACDGDGALFEDVTDRLTWERKMNGFLLEPLVPRVETDRPFKPGDVISERFEIVREVAEGGMAIVYEAHDRRLEGTIAIKCPKPGFRRRLPPELQNALKVSHPNVCRLHGIETAKLEAGEVEFLTMEFLSGQTLAERLRETNPVPVEEAIYIARQICAGLAEAHRKGVVHGDLKPSNIILARDRSGAIRAVITDFGLAQPVGGLGAVSGQASRMRGTPDFVAPELWKGGRLSVASDLYALGVILYELACGQRPFAGQDVEERFKASPPPPARHRQSVPAQWNRAVTQCLAPRPADRPSSAEAVAQLLEAASPRFGKWLAAAAAVVVLSAAGWLWKGSAAPGPPVRLAVVDLLADGESKALSRGVTADVSARLTGLGNQGNRLVVIAAKEGAGEQPGGGLGATHILRGTLRESNGRYQVQAQVWDAEVKHKIREFEGEYTLAEIGSLPTALVGTVAAALKLKGSGNAEPLSQAAYPSYVQGIERLRHDLDSADEAIRHLEESIAIDAKSALPWAALAEAQILKFRKTNDRKWLGKAQESAKKAVSLNPDAVEVLLLSGLVMISSGAYSEALADLQRAAVLSPGNSEVHRRMGDAYAGLNDPVNAMRAFQTAIQVQPGFFKPHMDLGLYYFNQGNFEESRRQFEQVTEIAPAVRDGHHNVGRTLLELGRLDEAERAFQRALRLHEESTSLIGLGSIKSYKNEHHEAVGYYEKALKAGPESALLVSNLGDAYRRTGNAQAASAAYQRAARLAEQDVMDNPRSAFARGLLGYLHARLGSRDRALFETGQALKLAPQEHLVQLRSILTYECLGMRTDTLKLVESSPGTLIAKLNRQPDLSELRKDRRFIQVSSKTN